MTYRPKHPTLMTAKASVVAGAPRGGARQRARLLAYGYLRGKGYRQIESHCHQGAVPQYERNDLDGWADGPTDARRVASAYVLAWCRGDVEPEYSQYGYCGESDHEVADRLKEWAAQSGCDRAVVRCPDLPGVTDGSVDRVGTPTPASGSEQAAPGLLAQVRDWLEH